MWASMYALISLRSRRRMLVDIVNNIPHITKTLDFLTIKTDPKGIFRIKQKLNGIQRIKSELFEF